MGVNKLTSNPSTSKISGNVTSAVPASVTLSGGTIATPEMDIGIIPLLQLQHLKMF